MPREMRTNVTSLLRATCAAVHVALSQHLSEYTYQNHQRATQPSRPKMPSCRILVASSRRRFWLRIYSAFAGIPGKAGCLYCMTKERRSCQCSELRKLEEGVSQIYCGLYNPYPKAKYAMCSHMSKERRAISHLLATYAKQYLFVMPQVISRRIPLLRIRISTAGGNSLSATVQN